MKIQSFNIQNFRSIINANKVKISTDDNVLILAGQNESGKTSVLEALDFFGNGLNKDFLKYQIRMGTDDCSVECNFEFTKKDLIALESSGFTQQLINKVKKIKTFAITRSYADARDGGMLITSPTEDELGLGVNDDALIASDSPEAVTVEKPDPIPSAPPEEVDSWDNLSSFILERVPIFSFYSNFDDLLPSEVLVNELQQHKAIQDFEVVFNTEIEDLANIEDIRRRNIELKKVTDRATDDFNKTWSQAISSFDNQAKYSFEVQVKDTNPKAVFFLIKGSDDIPLYLEQKSKGFRWFSAFHLRLRSLEHEYGSQNKSDQRDIVLLIDEPGQNLHETAQKDAKKIIDETAQKGLQIIFTTHHANLLGNKDIEFSRIRLVEKNKDLGTKVYNIAQFLSQVKGSSDTLSPIKTALGLSSIQPLISEKGNVLTEGLSDSYYLKAFSKLLKTNKNYSFIPACGADNAKSVAAVLLGWDIDFRTILDDDAGKGRKIYNSLKKNFYNNNDEEAQEFIHKIKGCDGIEDIFSQDELSKYIINREITSEEIREKNSKIVDGKKEMHARLFLDKVSKKPSDIKLSAETKKKIKSIFDWLENCFSND